MQQESNMPQPLPPPKEKQSLKGLTIALIIILSIGLPISYYTGQSNGYHDGQTSGYLEGFNSGWETGRFDFYYIKPQQKFGVYNLSAYVESRKWIKPYQEGVFDCSEMSAALEWRLENEGWHTIIVVGNSPFGSGKHAWLLVETSVGQYMPVESTSMSVVWWDNLNFDKYFVYDHSFETIQEALAYSETEFDWWKS